MIGRLLRRVRNPAREGASLRWKRPFEVLRRKWKEVPGELRVDTSEWMNLDDHDLLRRWTREREVATTGPQFRSRGWYHEMYAPVMRDAVVVDFGSGLGMDALHFATTASRVICVDIVKENLDLIQRVAGLRGVDNVETHLVSDIASFEGIDDGIDVVFAQGSLHHAPAHVVAPEMRALATRLRCGGRWIQLAYPKARWVRDGRLPFHRWGEVTDGPGTPWAEWLDLPEVLARLHPYEFDVLLHFNFHDDDFNWFDLIKR